MSVWNLVILGGGLVASGLALVRWLRVAQREHYLPGAASRFAWRWWSSYWWAAIGALLAVAGVVLSLRWVTEAAYSEVVVALGPPGLSIRGRTSPLGMTRRLKTLAGSCALLSALVVGGAGLAWGWRGAAVAAAAVAVATPLVVDLASLLLRPGERRAARRYVEQARRRLAEVHPRVVAITGSYGKTTTKGYVAELLSGRFSVLASPRSFNNQAGLSRTVNEHLVSGTEVLIAEMGTYGPGELRELCSWLTPSISVITAIGPVHLERFGSLDAILKAKSEITELAETVVLNVDDERLAALALELAATGRRVITCGSASDTAQVRVRREGEQVVLRVEGEEGGAIELPDDGARMALTNVACAIGVALALQCPVEEISSRLGGLGAAANRLSVERAANGATILDDTFNSNPAGARLALEALEATGAARKVLVTPGMIELGEEQFVENARFAHLAASIATDLVLVGRTNRKALVAGVLAAREEGHEPRVELVAAREDAVELVRRELGEEDAVLYENDLPDHFP